MAYKPELSKVCGRPLAFLLAFLLSTGAVFWAWFPWRPIWKKDFPIVFLFWLMIAGTELFIGPSDIHGYGVISLEDVEVGDVVSVIFGRWTRPTKEEIAALSCRYVLSSQDFGTFIPSADLGAPFRTLFDFFNHESDGVVANATFVILSSVAGRPVNRIHVECTRKIFEGNEVVVDYKL